MKPGCVLVVDDDHDTRSALTGVLEQFGYEVVTAQHGGEAVTLLEKGLRAGCILLDVMMPVMNGEEFYQWLRADTRFSQVPVIPMSAHSGRQLPGDTRLAKPIHLKRLIDAVAGCFQAPLPEAT